MEKILDQIENFKSLRRNAASAASVLLAQGDICGAIQCQRDAHNHSLELQRLKSALFEARIGESMDKLAPEPAPVAIS